MLNSGRSKPPQQPVQNNQQLFINTNKQMPGQIMSGFPSKLDSSQPMSSSFFQNHPSQNNRNFNLQSPLTDMMNNTQKFS